MTSKIKVDNITDQNDNNIINESGDVITVGAAGDTVAVAGNIVKSNALQASDGGNIVNQSGTTITIGASGDTVSLASGASQSGFGRSGSVDWQTGSIKTSTFTAADGEGYFVDTSSGAVEVDLPAGSAGAIVAINDYASTAATNNITIDSNGSEKIMGSTTNHIISTNGVTVTLVYVDSTQGWKLVDTGEAVSMPQVALFTTATGGTITCSGDYKIHTFTGHGTFCVSQIGNGPTNPNGGPTTVSYVVLAGGGSSGACGSNGSGGGGAGGFREGRDITPSYTASPLVAPAGLTITASPFSVTVGGGGAGHPGSRTAGSPSTFSTITSAGGGAGSSSSTRANIDGGSGGGGRKDGGPVCGGSGNTPPVSPPQGNPGGAGQPQPGAGRGGGGGGAGAAGADISGTAAGAGGNGVASSITGSPVTRGGGGGGAAENGPTGPGGAGGSGGSGGGGNGVNDAGCNGGTNLGGGGGADKGSGGSGVVIIRYKFQ